MLLFNITAFLLFTIYFLYDFFKEFEWNELKTSFKQKPIRVLSELLTGVCLYAFAVNIIFHIPYLSQIAVLLVILTVVPDLSYMWKRNKFKVILAFSLFILYFSLPNILR